MEVYHVNHNPRLYGHSQPWLSDHDPHSWLAPFSHRPHPTFGLIVLSLFPRKDWMMKRTNATCAKTIRPRDLYRFFWVASDIVILACSVSVECPTCQRRKSGPLTCKIELGMTWRKADQNLYVPVVWTCPGRLFEWLKRVFASHHSPICNVINNLQKLLGIVSNLKSQSYPLSQTPIVPGFYFQLQPKPPNLWKISINGHVWTFDLTLKSYFQ